MVGLIIYDLDGTLIDSGKTVSTILNGMRIERRMDPSDQKAFIPWLSLGGEDLMRNALQLEDDVQVAKSLSEFRRRYVSLPTDPDTVYPGIPSVLESLLSLGFRLAICTNKPRRLAQKVIEETGLFQYFEFMNAGGDLLTRKPDPANLLSCMDFFKASHNEAYFVGDSLVDQAMAHKAQVPFVFFRGGYNDGVDEVAIHKAIEHHHEILPFVTFKENAAK